MGSRCGQRPWRQSHSGVGTWRQTLHRASFTALGFRPVVPVPIVLPLQKLASLDIHPLANILTDKARVCNGNW